MDQQQYFLRMQMLGQEAEKIEQQIQIIEQQIGEMNAVRETLEAIKSGKETEILANLGKGIFAKADLRSKDKNLFVNVGKDVAVKKTPEETLKIIDEQVKRLVEGKADFVDRISELQENMQALLMEAQKSEPDSKEHSHEHKCENKNCECEKPCEECECEKKDSKEKKSKKK